MEWRGYGQLLKFREYIRAALPGFGNGNGFVALDLDLIVRTYGVEYNTDQSGKFCLIELKYGTAQMTRGQENTFSLITKLLRQADPKKERFLGFYLVQYSDQNWEIASFRVNNIAISREKLTDLLLCKDIGISGLFEK